MISFHSIRRVRVLSCTTRSEELSACESGVGNPVDRRALRAGGRALAGPRCCFTCVNAMPGNLLDAGRAADEHECSPLRLALLAWTKAWPVPACASARAAAASYRAL